MDRIRKDVYMKAEDKYINYLNEIMQDHWGNNKSIYVYNGDGEETPEWKKIDRMNNKIMWIVRDYFEKKDVIAAKDIHLLLRHV